MKSDITLTNWNSGGYGFINSNFASTKISNVSIGKNSAKENATKQFFAAYNAGTFDNCKIYFSSYNSNNYFAETSESSANVTSCKVNGKTGK